MCDFFLWAPKSRKRAHIGGVIQSDTLFSRNAEGYSGQNSVFMDAERKHHTQV